MRSKEKESEDVDDELTWDICGRIKAEGKLENCVKEGRGRMKMGGEKQCLKPRATLEFTSNGKEKKRFTHKQVNAHTHSTPVWCWGVFVCWVTLTECCRCYLLMLVWPATMPWKKHWWAGFKEPYLLFQHQKVHLGASVIFHPFPRLRSYYDEQ